MNKETLIKYAEEIRDEYKIAQNTANRVGSLLVSMINYTDKVGVDIEVLSNHFLRKDQDDTTEHLITFLAGLNLGTKYSLDENGNAKLNNINASDVKAITALFNELEATKIEATEGDVSSLTAFTLLVKSLADVQNLNVKETATILNAVIKGTLSSPNFISGFLGEGFRIAKSSNGDWNLELDNLVVRKVFHVFELLVQEVKHQGGVVVHSPAGGKITKVTDGGSYWKCEIESADTFFKDDLVLCQKFTGKNIKRYWRLATSAGDGFVNLSKSDCEANSAVPEEGDEIATLGNKTNTARQSAYLISVVGTDAPYTAYYIGINSYSLKGKEHTRIGNLEGVVSPVFGPLKGHGASLENAYVQGMIHLQNGKSVETVIDETSNKLSGDIGKVQTDLRKDINSSVTSVRNELGSTISSVENNFNTSLNSTKSELNSSINKAQGDADTAKGLAQQAQDSIDDLDIGGENLIYNSDKLNKGGYGRGFSNIVSNEDGSISFDYDGSGGLSLGWVNGLVGGSHIKDVEDQFKEGEECVFSCWVSSPDQTEPPMLYIKSTMGYRTPIGKIGVTPTRVYYVYKWKKSSHIAVHLNFKENVGTYTIHKFKLEKGNKATDWSLASEDIEAQINAVTKEIKNVEQRFEIAEGQISSNIKETTQLITEAKLANGESVKTLEQVKVQINDINVTAGQINTTLGEVNKKQGEINSSISNLEQTAGSFKTSIEGFKETEADIKATANKIEATHEGIVLEASEKSAKKAIDDLEIGGSNIALGTSKPLSSFRSRYIIPTSKLVDIKNSGSNLCVSFEIKSLSDKFSKCTWYILGNDYNTNVTKSEEILEISDDFKKYVIIVSNKEIYERGLLVGDECNITFASNGENVCLIRKVKIEKGNKSTDWTPASEDMASILDLSETNSKLEVNTSEIKAQSNRINALTGRVSNAEAELNPDKIWLKVKDNTQKEIDKIEIGGRNYFLFKRQNYGSEYFVGPYHTLFNIDRYSNTLLFLGRSDVDISNISTFILSYDIKVSDDYDGEVHTRIRILNPDGSTKTYLDVDISDIKGWNRCSNIISNDDNQSNVWRFQLYNYMWAKSSIEGETYKFHRSIEIKNIKLEVGTKKTDWTPAPEDLASISSLVELESKFEVESGKILAQSQQINKLEGEVNSAKAELTPDRIWAKVSSNTQKAIDDINIGVYNIIKNSKTISYVGNASGISRAKKDDYFGYIVDKGNANWASIVFNYDFSLIEADTDYVFSVDVFYVGKSSLPPTFYTVSTGYRRLKGNLVNNEWVRVYLVFNPNNTNYLNPHFGFKDNEGEYYFKNLSVTKGNHKTEWTPSIDEFASKREISSSFEMTLNRISILGKDIDMTGKVTFGSFAPDAKDRINKAQSTADHSAQDIWDLRTEIGDLAFEDKIEVARLGQTIIEGGFLKTDLLQANSIKAEKLDIKSLEAVRIRTGNLDVLDGATIAGFSIGNGRIGSIADPNNSSFGHLSIYKDFFRVGGNDGYAMLGNNVIPSTAGGAFNATGRIVNKTPNTGSQWGFDTSNYGLFIDVSGGTKNYGIKSNAAIISPANIGTEVASLLLNGTSYKIDFSQSSVFIMNRTRAGGISVNMPDEYDVARQFGMRELPIGFGFIFTVVGAAATNKIVLTDLYDRSHNLSNFGFNEGDSATILAYKVREGFKYQVLTYNT